MRFAAILFTLLLPLTAYAGETTEGGSGGGGRLGKVSGGIRDSGGSGGRQGSGGNNDHRGTRDREERRDERGVAVVYVPVTVDGVVVSSPPPRPRWNGGPARFEAYVGAQKVHESEGSWTVELGIRDGLFRLGGSITRYYERQANPTGLASSANTSRLTMTMPSLIGGFRIDDRGPTKVYLELGAVNARTSGDVMGDSSITGGLGGVRIEHRMSKDLNLVGELHELMFEDDVRAHSARAGVRFGVLQASFRVLDFNVGPPLYGPELGLKF
ncbi:MAG: hypothetical protein H0V17_09700 [Deltaproteobacteria bacterium]|nr:hypothetical protein [Deltaproteobacteria bacterium]